MNKCKIVIFSDLHYRDEKPLYKTRKLTEYSIPLLDKLAYKINNEIKPDLCINLGDLIEDTANHEKDIINLKFIWEKLKIIKVPFYSLAGNHDLRMMQSRKEVEDIMGYEHSTFSFNLNGYHFILLGNDVVEDISRERGGLFRTQYISSEDLKWLEKDLANNDLPTLIFTHFGVAEDDLKENWWFHDDFECGLLKNRKQLKEIIEKYKNILGFFSGHQHWTKKIIENNITYYILGSLTENINNDNIPDGVYFVVNLEDDKMQVTENHLNL